MTTAEIVETVPSANREVGVPYNLRIGVTGHRIIDDHAAVAAAVRTLIERVLQTLDRSEVVPLRWVVVSPIASGADQIVAEAMLGLPATTLEVLLPFELDEYRKDFKESADHARFEALLARAAQIHRLSGPFGEERDADSDSASRDLVYLRLGQQVVETSEIVIAVWNGRKPAGPGGTADVVEYALEHQRHVLWIDAENPARDARMIRSVRRNVNGDVDYIESVELRSVADQLSQGYSQQLAYYDETVVSDAAIARKVAASSRTLITTAAECGLGPADIEPVTTILPHYIRADLLAQFYQRRHVRVIEAVMIFAGAGVTIAVAQAVFSLHENLIAFELLGMAMALGLWRYSRHAGWHTKWLHNRYLAERIRLTMFVALVDRPPGILLDGGLPFYPGPQHWLRGIADELARVADSLKPRANATCLGAFLLHAWFADQYKFHSRNFRRISHRAHRRHMIGIALFIITFVMATLHLFGVAHDVHADPGLDRIDLWIGFLAIVLPVWAGGIHAVTAQLELERVAERSHRMTRALAGTVATLRFAETPSDLTRTVREAASLMAKETHEWWVLLSFQDVRLHV